MSTQVQLRRGTTTQCLSMTPAQAEVVVDTTQNRLRVGDGSTAGGNPVATVGDIVNNNVTISTSGLKGNAIGAINDTTVSIAAATTTDIGGAAANYITITGAATITSFGSNGQAGQERWLEFAGINTLTNSSNLVLPAATNITTAAGDVAAFRYEGGGVWRCVSYLTSGAPVTSTAGPSVVGTFCNLVGAYASATTATWSADEIVVKSALAGSSYLLKNFSKTLNTATTGAGGLDTGSMANSKWYYVYAIYNPNTGTQNILCTISGSGAAVYGGANMPSGYTSSALIGVFRTNGSAQIATFNQSGRTVSFPNINALVGGAAVSYTSVDLSGGIVPPNAKFVTSGNFGTSSANVIYLAGDASGTGRIIVSSSTGSMSASLSPVPILNGSQILYYYVSSGTGNFDVSGYSF